ncbi:MAG: TOBE domain-containing protein, partial [Halobacteriales archaeon]
REPASRFVAEFVGDNNVFEATVDAGDPPRATPTGAAGDGTLPLSEPRPAGESVTLSVRPEALRVLQGDEPELDASTAVLQAAVEHVEFVGDAYRVHCEWAGRSLLVKTATEPPGGTVRLAVDAANVTVV